jgi:hypothetical protein
VCVCVRERERERERQREAGREGEREGGHLWKRGCKVWVSVRAATTVCTADQLFPLEGKCEVKTTKKHKSIREGQKERRSMDRGER